mmetsp:Transcript_61803/g.119063  ORF Transcript_61803/g.119063 Transcript_61803/m.119063 type:complete len:104 (+) Transcript_61803:454-765(+)
MLAPDLSTHGGELARQTMLLAAAQRLGHELRAACDTLSRSALPSVAVAVQGSWVPASGPQAHPLDERKKHMESAKLPEAVGVMECILYCMDDSAAFVASPEHQ